MASAGSRSPLLRRSRALIVHRRHWRARSVFWLGALTVGLVGTGFAKLADLAGETFRRVSGGGTSLWLLLVLPLAFITSGWMAQRFFPGSQGSGIPQAIAARELHGSERGLYLSLRIAAGKIVLTLWGLLFGASIGREGPTVQVGAAIMLAGARFGGLQHARGLILAGSAAGIAAAFNTPLAGIVFAIEEMSRSYQARSNGIVLSTVVIAGISALAISGSYIYFGEPKLVTDFPRDWRLVVVIGILGGALGAGFSRAVLYLTRRIRRWKPARPWLKLVAVAGGAGLVVAVLGLASQGATFGTSYDEARAAVAGEPVPMGFFLAKLAATLASTVSGIPGGCSRPRCRWGPVSAMPSARSWGAR